MLSRLSRPVRIGAIALLMSAAAPAVMLAQSAPPPPAAAPAQPGQPGPGRMHGDPAARMAERLQRLHDELKITPAQQPQWDAVVAAVKENGEQMRQQMQSRPTPGTAETVPDRLARAETMAQTHLAMVQKLRQPVETLYQSLDPQQKQVADRELMRMERHADAGRHGRHHHGPHHGPAGAPPAPPPPAPQQ